MIEALAKAFGPILKRIGEFFDLFDLSFFVSGGITLLAVIYLARGAGIPMPANAGVGWAVACLVLAYFLGLICFAVGRSFRRLVGGIRDTILVFRGKAEEPYGERLYDIVADHGLIEDDIVGIYVKTEGKKEAVKGRLIARMWAELRERPGLKESFDYVNHSWVLAATYDGVAAAALIWSGALLLGKELAAQAAGKAVEAGAPLASLPDDPFDPAATVTMLTEPLVTPIVTALLIFAVIASLEARRSREDQSETLVATMAHLNQEQMENQSGRGGGGVDVAVDVDVGGDYM